MAYDEDYLFDNLNLNGPGYNEKSGYVIIGKKGRGKGKIIDTDGDVVVTTLGEWGGTYIHSTQEQAETWAREWWGKNWKAGAEIGFISLRYSIDPVNYSDAVSDDAEDDGLDGVDLDEDLDAPLDEEGGTVRGRVKGPAIPALDPQVAKNKTPVERVWAHKSTGNKVADNISHILDRYYDKSVDGTIVEAELLAMKAYEFTEK